MRNSTLKQSGFFRLSIFIVFLLLSAHNVSAQFYTKHYIAPAPWQYFSKANEIVIATNSTSTVNIAVSRSNGTLVTNLTAVKGAPAVYRFAGLPKDAPAHALNTVLNAAGLIINADAPVSINLRNVASDALGGDGSDKDIKGNAALTSFGDAGIGIRFRIGYYRDGSLGNFGDFGDQRPIYSIMATADNTTVKVNNAIVATLNTGQSYLFKANIGTLVESSNPSVMNTSAAIDTPNGCGDGAYNQIPPEAVLGTEYFIERGKGNDTAEQTTVVATKDNTALTINTYSTTGDLVGTNTLTLPTAGSFYTFRNGVSNSSFSASRVAADKRVAVYSGTARSCEVDIYTIAPVSECGGSNFVETAKFRDYGTGSLPYFGYILLRSATEVVSVNGTNIETISGISARHQLGSTGWYVINFEDTQIGSPNILSISSAAKLTVSIVQQGGGFTMAGFFSNFAIQPEDPTFTYVSGGGCTNNTATLTTASGLSPYQWYLNGVAINGANSDTYTATKTGAYSVASTLTCGAQTQSKPVSVTLCTDLEVKKTVNIATPCVGSNVEFTVALNNLGVNNSTGVSVNDLLPTGYTFVSSTASVGSYNSTTGVWSIGDVNGGAAETLKITAKVNASGVYNNIASLPSTIVDSNSTNNSASVSTTPNPLPTLTINNPASVCSPSTVNLTAPAVTAGSSSNLTFTYWTNSTATTAYTTPTAATAGTYYIKATTTSGCSDIKPVIVKVATPPNAGTLSGTQSICVGNNTTFSSNGNTGGAWTSSDTSIATVTSAGVVNGLSAGTATITYRVTGTGGCSDATSTRTVTVTAAPNAGTLSGTQTICVGNNTTFSSNGNTGGAWTSSDTSIATVTSAGVVNGLSAGTATITYRVTGTGGCSDATSTRTVTVNAMPAAPAASSQSFCSTDAKKVSDLLPSGSAYKWYDVATAGTALQATDVLTTKTYYVSETLNGCEGPRRSVAVTVTTTPSAPTLSTITQPTCFSATGSFTITNYNSSYTYTVTPSTGVTRVNDIVTVPSGSYTIKASINSCETSTNFTVNSQICAVAETFPTSVNGLPGGDTTESLILGDKLNNAQAVIGTNPGQVSISPVTVPTGFTINTDGTVKVPANTKAGDYNVEYSICEINNTNNCSTATSVVKVSAPVIDAVGDNVTSINGNIGGTTVALSANDTLNGNPIIVGIASGEVTLNIIGTLPTGLTLNADYTITVAPNTPAANYNVEYKICENNNPTNCDSITITIPVTVGNLIANVDLVSGVIASNASQTLGTNVLDNDTKNGLPLNPSDVTLSTLTPDPTGYLVLNPDGILTLKANAPAGNYELTYQICEKLNTGNCDSNTVKVSVSLPVIDAVGTTLIPSINGSIGGTTTTSVVENDTLNGNPFVLGNLPGQVKLTAVNVPSGLTLNADGTVTVLANTPAGVYNVEYSICEITNPTNCDTAISKVAVNNGVLVANTDTIPSRVGSEIAQPLGINVLDNDTKNGLPLNPSDVTLTTSTPDPSGYLVLNPDGTVTLGANPPVGTYEVTYTICENLNPGNCSSNTVKITVDMPVIDAVSETLTPSITGSTGGKTTSSVIENDKINGKQAVIGNLSGQVKLTAVNVPSGLTLNADGTVTVAINTPSGIYNIEYSICEISNPTNCDSAISKVAVNNGVLVANTDLIPSITASNTPQTFGVNVFDNDTKDGLKLNPSDVTLSTSTPDPKGYLVLNPNGTLTLGANAPAGNYDLTYTICEKLNAGNCSSNTVRVIVDMPVIDAVADPVTSISGNIGGTTISLIANDKLNGSPVVVGTAPGEVTFALIGTLPTGLTLNPDFTITVAPNTPAGNYNVEYSICDNINSTNCDSVISVITVSGGNLIANQDIVPSAVGVNVPQTLINVFVNDTKDGNALVPSDVNLNVTIADPKGYLTVDANGNAILAPNAPAGDYELTYTICEKLNPLNCNSNVVKVTVTEPKMTVTANSYCSNNVPYVNYTVTPDNFTTNNKLTVKWIDSSNNVVATQTNLDLSGNLIWPGAIVDGNGNGVDWPGWVLNNGQWMLGADGFEGTRNGVKMEFSLNPTVTVSVSYPVATAGCNPNPSFSITANNDEAGPIDVKKGTDATINIFNNDILNGVKPTPSDIVLSTVVANPNLVLNADGSVTILANTPSGVYQLTYQICEAANTSNCSQAVVKITVVNNTTPAPPTSNAITLVNDDNIIADGINGDLEFVNVLNNDLISGQPINPADVTIKALGNNSNFEFNPDGTVNVKPNTPGGNYAITYQVCEKANATNCATAVLNVFVEVPAIAIIKTAEFNDLDKSGFANAGETITYKFTVTNTGNVPLINVTVKDPLTGVVVSGQAISLAVGESNNTNFTAVYKITQEDINIGKVTNQATAHASSTSKIVVEDKSDDLGNDGDNPTVLSLDGCSIKVFNAFSPNGDAKNARFFIRGIECYPNNTVEIYNRWGVLVYSIDQYDNNDRVFVGYSNGRSTIKQTEGLPVGTYFYILKYQDSSKTPHEQSGYLYINK